MPMYDVMQAALGGSQPTFQGGGGTGGGNYYDSPKAFKAERDQIGLAGERLGLQNQQIQQQLAQQKLQLFPWMMKQFGGLGGAPPAPAINASPIWNPQQIQQRTNAAWAQNDQRTESSINNMTRGLTSRGFGTGSPLLAALEAQYRGQGLAANSTAAREIDWGAAQGNAKQVLDAETASAKEVSDRYKTQAGLRSALLDALTRLGA